LLQAFGELIQAKEKKRKTSKEAHQEHEPLGIGSGWFHVVRSAPPGKTVRGIARVFQGNRAQVTMLGVTLSSQINLKATPQRALSCGV
jgi:hypothetical protein